MTGSFSKKDLLFFRNFRSGQISDVALRPPLLIAQTVRRNRKKEYQIIERAKTKIFKFCNVTIKL